MFTDRRLQAIRNAMLVNRRQVGGTWRMTVVQTVLSQTFWKNERSSGRQINLFRKGIELMRRT
jgi:hypothetical protein